MVLIEHDRNVLEGVRLFVCRRLYCQRETKLFTLLLDTLYRYKLFYTKSSFRFEIALICINTFTEHCRQMLATRGNLTDSATPLLWSLGFSCLVLMAHVYFFSLQVYVLRVDRVLNGGALGVLSTGALLSLGALVEMGRL